MARVCVSVSYENRNYRDYGIAEKGMPKSRGSVEEGGMEGGVLVPGIALRAKGTGIG